MLVLCLVCVGLSALVFCCFCFPLLFDLLCLFKLFLMFVFVLVLCDLTLLLCMLLPTI